MKGNPLKFSMLLFSGFVFACATVQADIWQDYLAAVEDAKTVEPPEIYEELTAITPSNNDLVRDAAGRALVSTWADDYYKNNYQVGDTIQVSAAHLIWEPWSLK